MPRLVEWDGLQFRLRGDRLAEMAGEEIVKSGAPVSSLTLLFEEDLLRIHGKIRKAIAIPFTVEIRRIDAFERSVRVFLHHASAFGIPLPTFLVTLVQHKLQEHELTYEPESRSFLVRLDRFLPSFLDVTLAEVRLVAGGVLLRVGAGGADPPPSGGTNAVGSR